MNKNLEKKPQFTFNEIVKILDSKHNDRSILNTTGYVAGMVLDDDNKWQYGVLLIQKEEVWRFDEEHLESTGEFVPKEVSFSGETIKVLVDKHGRGKVK